MLSKTFLPLAAFLGIAAAQVNITATATFYSSGGCTGTADNEAFFNANYCEPIPSVLKTVTSVEVTNINFPGCKVFFYTDATCTTGETLGVLDHCEQASGPFVAAKVDCPE